MGSPPAFSILHLLPHAGGGVGTVLRAIVKESMKAGGFRHTVVTLESLNSRMQEWCAANGIGWFENAWDDAAQLCALVGQSDIVHIHWWNHPLLHAVLRSFPLPEMRTALWSHVNGLFVPQIFFKALVDFPDFFVLATPCSMESALVSPSGAPGPSNIRIIQSSAGIPAGIPEKIIKPDTFRAGYIGTVDYSKMHKNLIAIWAATGIADFPLLVCGGPAEEEFRKEVASRGVSRLFDIRGVVDDVPGLLSELHVFTYPLASTHYGTGEQVLLEAMAFGAVPVVMNNGCERSLVKDRETGIVAASEEEFVQAILFLRDNSQLRNEMAEKGRQHVSARFGLAKTVEKWHALYEELLGQPKRRHCLVLRPVGNLPDDSTTTLLINSYGDSIEARKIVTLLAGDTVIDRPPADLRDLPPACFSKTRGSPFHYRNTLPSDPSLEKICRALAAVAPNEYRNAP